MMRMHCWLAALAFITPLYMSAATPTLKLEPGTGLNNQITGAAPVQSSGCSVGSAGIVMNNKSTLQYQIDGAKLAQAGTLIMEFKPDKSWFSGALKEPEILFQMGNQHWEPNNITIIREPGGWLVTRFHDGNNQQAFNNFHIDFLRGKKIVRLGVTWNKDGSTVYLNGAKQFDLKPCLPAKLSDLAAIGCAINRPGWSFGGLLSGCSIYDRKATAAEMEELTMADDKTKPQVMTEPYVKMTGDVVQIGNGDFEMQITKTGMPLALYDKKAGKFLNNQWGDGSWWGISSEKSNINLSSNRCSAKFAVKTIDGCQTACFDYEFPAHKGNFKAYIWAENDGALCFRYGVDNRYAQPIQFVYFPGINGIKKSADGWVVQPWWNGVKRNMRNFQYMCWGGPGHLSMMFMGMQAGDSTLLFYPEDTPGSVRFAIADDSRSGPEGIMNLCWQNRDYIMPGEQFRSSSAFRLYNLGNTGLKGMAEKYREWGSKQPWFMTWEQKLKQAPVISETLNGVIKMAGFEAVSKDSSVYASKEYKEKNCKILTYTYNRFLEVARNIEKLYKVKPAYRYDGWWGRFDSRYPNYFPVDPELGDFKQFMDVNNRDGRMVFLHTNPIQWDSDDKDFDLKNMSISAEGKPESMAVWSRNNLYFCSPPMVKDVQVAAEKQMLSYGVKGIFEDVIGCSTMIDCNPKAGYKYKWRDSGTVSLAKLSAALRAATPGVFRGTEGGTERGIPNYDAFMLGAGDVLEESVPLFGMVYGDCFANSEGICGGGEGLDHITRARCMLFGMILGMDGRYGWAADYSPAAQMIFETQALLKQVVGKRILDYSYDEKSGLALTQWQNATVCANLSKTVCPVAEFKTTTMGNIKCEGLQSGGAVLILRGGQFVAWGCRQITVDGKMLAQVEGSEGIALAFNGKTLAVANAMTPKFPETTVCVTVPGAIFSGSVVIRPEDTRANTEKSGASWKFTIPAGKTAYLK